jgi:N-acyl-D-aspartate/D-glutamate deacylase
MGGPASVGVRAQAARYDWLITRGTVIDGTGAPRIRADVAIRGDRIVAVAPDLDPSHAAHVIDASGQIVAPGFIDNHAHLVTLEKHPHAENFLRQGITTIMASLHGRSRCRTGDASPRLDVRDGRRSRRDRQGLPASPQPRLLPAGSRPLRA